MYETARRIIHTTGLRPQHLFASGARPPDRISDQSRFEERVMQDSLKLAEFRIGLPAYAQPDDVFAELIRHFNVQATDRLLSEPELRELMLPVMRAEFEMATNYHLWPSRLGKFRSPASRQKATRTCRANTLWAGTLHQFASAGPYQGRAPISRSSTTWRSFTMSSIGNCRTWPAPPSRAGRPGSVVRRHETQTSRSLN